MKWGTPSRLHTDLYREQTAAKPPITLRRKQCACGKVVTAKQLVQQGGCDACARQAAAVARKEAA